MVLASDLTGWWVGYAIGAAIVVVVALLLIAIIVTAKRIATIADDATRSLVVTRDRTEPLWDVATTNKVASDLLAAARQARKALGGGEELDDERDTEVERARAAERRPFPTGPDLDPELGL